MLRKIIISSIILPVFLSTVFCCCVRKIVFAGSSPQIEHCHSHAGSNQRNSSKGHDSRKPDDCQCSKIFNLSDRSLRQQFILPVVYNFNFHPILIGFIQNISPRAEGLISFHSPPVPEADFVPTYLKHRVLRI